MMMWRTPRLPQTHCETIGVAFESASMRLLPRDEQFYQLFLKHIDKSVQAASLLAEAADLGDGQLATAASRIHALEQEADEVIHEIYLRLNSTFITPIDPEDIHSLSSSLDDILTGLED